MLSLRCRKSEGGTDGVGTVHAVIEPGDSLHLRGMSWSSICKSGSFSDCFAEEMAIEEIDESNLLARDSLAKLID